MGSSPPPPPSPYAGLAPAQQAGTAQQGFSIGSQAGSEVGQQNIWGGLNYAQTGTGPGGVPLYTATTSLSPSQQQAAQNYVLSQLQAGATAPNLLATGNYGSGQSPYSAITQMAGNQTSGMLGNEVNYLQPFFNLQKTQEQAQLENQGFTPGSTAYNNAMMPLMTGQDLSVSNFLAQAFPQAYQMSAGTYQLPLSMSQQLAQWGAPQMPGGQFVQTPQLSTVPFMQAYGTAQEAAQAQYEAQQQQYNNMMSGMFGLGEAGVGALGQLGGASILAAAI